MKKGDGYGICHKTIFIDLHTPQFIGMRQYSYLLKIGHKKRKSMRTSLIYVRPRMATQKCSSDLHFMILSKNSQGLMFQHGGSDE